MARMAIVGAARVEIERHKCSIKKISVSTKWKAPTEEIAEEVTTTVFDNQKEKEEKTIYLISSPQGKKITIKTEREDGKCWRENHKKYVMLWDDYKKWDDDKNNIKNGTGGKDNSSFLLKLNKEKSNFVNFLKELCPTKDITFLFPIAQILVSTRLENEIKNEESFDIKCYEIGGIEDVLKYMSLPIPSEKIFDTRFSYTSCLEGPIHFHIISYPDISFKYEFTVGAKEAKKEEDETSQEDETSHFERETSKIKNVPERTIQLIKDKHDLKLTLPSITLSSSYNGDNEKLELTIDPTCFFKESDKEGVKFKYTNKVESKEFELSSRYFQNDGAWSDNTKNILGQYEFLKELLDNLRKIPDLKRQLKQISEWLSVNYKPYELKLNPSNISLSAEGKYRTSRDLTKIGKFYDLCFFAEPLVDITLKIDFLFIIINLLLNVFTAGTGSVILNLLKNWHLILRNLDKVIEKILGNNYKKKYKDAKPFEADVFIDVIVTGAINFNVKGIIDTTEDCNMDSESLSVEGVLKLDVKAGAKCSLDVFWIEVGGELSASGSTGIKLKTGFENLILQGKGLAFFIDTFFLGLEIKGCVKGKVGLMKVKSSGYNLGDGEIVKVEKKKIEALSKRIPIS